MIHRQPKIRQPESTDHELYEQLCALASSGALTPSEWEQLSDHLNGCSNCRQELPKYQKIANSGMALLAHNDVSLDVENEWSPENTVARFIRRLQEEEAEEPQRENAVTLVPQPWWRRIFLPQLNSALPYAAVVIIVS